MYLSYLTLSLVSVLMATATTLTNWEQIHQTLSRYPLAVDTKNFTALSLIFAPDAHANYSTPTTTNLTGLAEIETAVCKLSLFQSVDSINGKRERMD
jgi:hypothetical protein